MIKAVIFDYGGVVSSGGAGHGTSARLAQNLGIDQDLARSIVDDGWYGLVRGAYSVDQFWAAVEKNYSKSIAEVARNIWNTWEQMHPRPEMITFIRELKAKGYTIGLLSNVIPSTSQDIRDHGGYDLFNPCLLSYQLGYAKPDHEMYEKLLGSLPGIKPEEILFVDDQEKCMPPARALGIRPLVATDVQKIMEGINSLLDS